MIQYVIFQIDGGLGKSIMATAILKAINKNTKVFITDPYSTSDYITESNHLLKIWCELYGLNYNGELPEIFLSKGEKDYFAPFYKLDKPIMAIHPNGGGEGQPLKYSWTRDLPSPVVNEVVNYFKNDYAIVHIKRDDQLNYENTITALDNWRSIAIMLTMSAKRLLIDSSCMHVASALDLPSVVGWVGTNPFVFGYDIHTNIFANDPTKKVNIESNSYNKHLLFEDISTLPYNDLSEIFDTQRIINALK